MPLALKEVQIVTLKLINEGMQKAQIWLLLHWFILLYIYYCFLSKKQMFHPLFFSLLVKEALIKAWL